MLKNKTIKGKQLLRAGQLGYLPESLENFFQFNSEKICQVSKRDTKLKPNVYCMLRVGVKTKENANNTFLASIALAIKEEEKRPNLNKLKSNQVENKNSTSTIEHEATTSKINEDQLFYCNQRGLDQEEAVSLIVNGFCKEVLQQLPMEFAVEAQKLVSISLEGSVG